MSADEEKQRALKAYRDALLQSKEMEAKCVFAQVDAVNSPPMGLALTERRQLGKHPILQSQSQKR